MEQVLVAWSGGKDSTLALAEILHRQRDTIAALLTTVTEGFDRISMHGVGRTLLERQAAALRFPLEIVYLSQQCTNAEYEAKMWDVLQKDKRIGVTALVFGDIFLHDVRA